VELSVVVPCHNVLGYLPDTLRSLRENAGPGIEIVLVDDASTDGTRELLEQQVPTVPGAVLVPSGHNRGLAGARNLGLAAARGEHLTFLDGDDWLAPGYLRLLADRAQDLGCDMVRVDHVVSESGRVEERRAPQEVRDVPLDPRDGILPVNRTTMVDYPFSCAGVYHRRLLERGLLRFDEELRTAEDRPWIWRLHRGASSYAVTSLAGVYYRKGVPTSLTQVGDARQLHFFDAFARILDELEDDPDRDEFRRKAARTFCAVLVHHLRLSGRLEPRVARELQVQGRRALRALPAGLYDETLAGMDSRRRAVLRRLRWRLPPVS